MHTYKDIYRVSFEQKDTKRFWWNRKTEEKDNTQKERKNQLIRK